MDHADSGSVVWAQLLTCIRYSTLAFQVWPRQCSFTHRRRESAHCNFWQWRGKHLASNLCWSLQIRPRHNCKKWSGRIRYKRRAFEANCQLVQRPAMKDVRATPENDVETNQMKKYRTVSSFSAV